VQQEVSDTLRGANLSTICVDGLLRDLVERFWSRYVDAMHRRRLPTVAPGFATRRALATAILHNRMLIAWIFGSIIHDDWVSGPWANSYR
jgi:hypothetical protein